MADHVYDTLIVGTGFTGIGAAIKLTQAGVDDIVLVERDHRVGGTWRDNTYPGAACDVPSHLYSFSFHAGSWPRRYSGQADILRYLEGVVDAFGLAPHLRLGAEVRTARFDEEAAEWRLELA